MLVIGKAFGGSPHIKACLHTLSLTLSYQTGRDSSRLYRNLPACRVLSPGRLPEFITIPRGWHAPRLFQRRGADPTQLLGGKASLSRPPSWPLALSLAQMTELSPGPFYHPLCLIQHLASNESNGPGGTLQASTVFPERRSVPGVHRTEMCGDWPTSSSEKPGLTWAAAARG